MHNNYISAYWSRYQNIKDKEKFLNWSAEYIEDRCKRSGVEITTEELKSVVERLFDVLNIVSNSGKWSAFLFDGIPVDYSGTLRIGRTFDYRYWQHDDKGSPVPFSPEVYKENGTIKIENGTVTETELHTRDN